MTLKPESSYQVTVTGRWLACQHPDGQFQRIALDEVRAVYFQSTPDPFNVDWWIVEGATADSRCAFPFGATGETEALAWLKQLPGFQIKGMNSNEAIRSMCWSRDAAWGATST